MEDARRDARDRSDREDPGGELNDSSLELCRAWCAMKSFGIWQLRTNLPHMDAYSSRRRQPINLRCFQPLYPPMSQSSSPKQLVHERALNYPTPNFAPRSRLPANGASSRTSADATIRSS
jgi:hypothetical protein